MDENQNHSEKIQELSIIITDRIRSVGRIWWYTLVLSFVLIIPFYYIMRSSFTAVIVSSHKFPAYIYEDMAKVPLSVTDQKIFNLGDGNYGGYIKIKNSANYEWGAATQTYKVIFLTTGGTEVQTIEASTFILPASEKIVVFPRFHPDKEPTTIKVTLGGTEFVHRSDIVAPALTVERVNLANTSGSLVITAVVNNKTPFTIKRIGLPVLLYDANNNVVGANYTSVDEVLYGETRSFQFSWPNLPPAVRAEVLPEVNIFDHNIYKLPGGSSQFDSSAITP